MISFENFLIAVLAGLGAGVLFQLIVELFRIVTNA